MPTKPHVGNPTGEENAIFSWREIAWQPAFFWREIASPSSLLKVRFLSKTITSREHINRSLHVKIYLISTVMSTNNSGVDITCV